MTQREKRRIALGATRSEARRKNLDPTTLKAEDAIKVLDDLSRKEPDLLACQWYTAASERQMKTFKREWNAWRTRRNIDEIGMF